MKYKLLPVVTANKVTSRINELKKQIELDYKNSNAVIFVSLLKGAYFFTTHLMSGINLKNTSIEFIKVSSYGNNMQSSNTLNIEDNFNNLNLTNKDVILVDDILDTGLTLYEIKKKLQSLNPKSLKVCVLVEKTGTNQTPLKADYVGFTLPNIFIVGCGLDYAEKHRELNYIAKVEEEA